MSEPGQGRRRLSRANRRLPPFRPLPLDGGCRVLQRGTWFAYADRGVQRHPSDMTFAGRGAKLLTVTPATAQGRRVRLAVPEPAREERCGVERQRLVVDHLVEQHAGDLRR